MAVEIESGVKTMLLGVQLTLVGFLLVQIDLLGFFTAMIGGLLIVLGIVFSFAGSVK